MAAGVSISEEFARGLLCLYFLAAAAAAAAASRWPLFASFAAHGKMRQQQKQQGQQVQQQRLQQSWLVRFLRWVESKDCSKLRFIDFYITGVFVTCFCLLSLHQEQQRINRQLLPLTLLLVHLLRRLGEQALLVASDEASRMHIFAYILGCTFYIATPLAFLCASRGVQGPNLLQAGASVGLWAISSLLQFVAHVSLASLRRQGARELALMEFRAFSQAANGAADEHTGAKKTRRDSSRDSSHGVNSSDSDRAWKRRGPYRVPRGPLFAYISCPHYLSEEFNTF